MQDSWGYLCTVVVVSASSQQVFWKISHLSSFPLKGTNYRIYQKNSKFWRTPPVITIVPSRPFCQTYHSNISNLLLQHYHYVNGTKVFVHYTIYSRMTGYNTHFIFPFQGTVYILVLSNYSLLVGLGWETLETLLLYIGLLWELMKKRISDVCKQMVHNLHFLCWKASYKANSS